MYKGLKIKGRYYSYLNVKKILYDFNTALRYSLDLISYDELRNYLAIRTRDSEDFVIPCEREIHSVMSGILSYGVVQFASNSNIEIVNIMNKLRSNLSNDTLSLIGNSPLIISLSNHLKGMIPALEQLSSDKMNLSEAIDKMMLIKIDRLVQMHRDVSTRAKNMLSV